MAATKTAERRRPARPAKRSATRPSRPRKGEPGTLLYAYCAVRGAQPDLADAPAGLPGMSPPFAVALGGDRWLIAAQAPSRLYGAAVIETRAGDLDWLSACALAHEAVIEQQMQAPALVPLKLFTLFSSAAVAKRRLSARRAALDETLDRLAGCAEWGVRVHARPDPALKLPQRAASGRGFLEGKRDARRAAQQALQTTQAEAERGFTALAGVAGESRRLPAPPGASPGLALDAVFLVPRRRQAKFDAAFEGVAARLAAGHAEVVLSGPWPAYHFVEPAG